MSGNIQSVADFRSLTKTRRPPHPRSSPINRTSRTNSLSFWHRVTLANVRNNSPDLTTRQLAILMGVYLETGPHTVRSLALNLDVTKAVICRAIDRLCKLGYVQRAPDPGDKRSIILTRTPTGIHYLRDFAEIIQTELPV